MSPTDASTLKRTASELDTSAASASSHGVKKARKDTGAEAQHTDDCEDLDCEGCAEGEIVLQFETKPSAVELFQMAREELANTGSGSGARGLSRMAKALFDKAIEEFEILEKAQSHIELNDGTEIASGVVETKSQHATCVVVMGNNIPSLEMLEEGTRMFEELAKNTAHKNSNVLVGLGIAQISQAKRLRSLAMKALNLEDEQDAEEPTEEQMDAAGQVGKVEYKLIESALDNFTKGLALLTDSTLFAQESFRASQELDEYGISLDLKLNQELATRVFDQAIVHLEQAQKSKEDLVDKNADMLSLLGSCHHSKAKLVDNQGEGGENPALKYVEKAIEFLTKAEAIQGEDSDVKTLETLGQAYLMSIDLIEDEDLIMERIDAAKMKLSRALELDPDNYALEQQVEALRGDEDDDEEGLYDDDDEDNDHSYAEREESNEQQDEDDE
ncbi:hypothetical protein EDD11_004376 [Mortierella claussenii]|nr:hypothetical protein EDD11_004376 [Mortierella claussenii]